MAYTGTNAEFSVFDKSKTKTASEGFFFTADRNVADTYGTNVKEVFLNIRNLKEENAELSSLDTENGKFDGISYIHKNAEAFVVWNPNQIKSATDNNGEFSRENDDIQMAMGRKQPEYITDSLTDAEKEDIRNVLRKINRAGRTLVDTGEGLYLVDHSDKEGIDNRKDNQEGFQCVAKIDTEGLRKQQIKDIKDGYQRTEKTSRGFNDWLETNGYSDRLSNSDNIDAQDRESNADNAGLDTETPQGEPRRGQGYQNSQTYSATGQVRTGFDGINGPRYMNVEGVNQTFTTPQGEVYGFVTPEGKMFLDRRVINASHPIHEYTHLWDRVVAKNNPRLWQRGVELMKQTSLWKEIEEDKNYGKKWKASSALSSEEIEFRIASSSELSFVKSVESIVLL